MDKLQLPRGPILLSPSSLLESLHREVIEKKPEIFKIECLKNIVNLFPPDSNPLVSGFGNRINDYKAYLEVGVPKSKIFIINEKGQIKQLHNQSYLSTYSTMVEFVDFMFPLLNTDKFCDFHINEYNDFFYWNKKY
uniref:Phosphatidate phosphatase LPIN2 (Trinotate prediction) n=1 Tax=Henneguya salminicola TaxID=69463 RepID=A0A6G3MH17_HENSL